MKRLFTMLLVIWVASCVHAHDFKSNGIYYKITSTTDKTVAVTYGYGMYSDEFYAAKYAGDVVIPSEVSYAGISYSVNSIEQCAFRECPNLYSLTIPTSITKSSW